MKQERIRQLNTHAYQHGPILYWMDREMRVHQNWTLVRAIELGKQHHVPVVVIYNLVKDYLGGGARQYAFKLGGLKEVESILSAQNIPFTVLLTGDSVKDIGTFCQQYGIGYLVTDMHPLRLNRGWKETLARELQIPVEVVDAHNIIPVWQASDKQEYAARTIRPRINKQLRDYLDPFPRLMKQGDHDLNIPPIPWNDLEKVEVDNTVTPVDWLTPGETAAKRVLRTFIQERLKGYAIKRNDPNEDNLSNLSPYFHYGMISPQYVVMNIRKAGGSRDDVATFIEESVVRRELADNFCYYNPQYDSVKGFPNWARETLKKHAKDKREYVYTFKEFEHAKTHDPLWNAAQIQMVQTGKMHGYMRMYWAKKILEWTKTPETALRFAITLNDKYELDGRDPNGYVGCAWSIGGVHDRPWFERPIFGTVRYMNSNGCARKFDVQAYIQTWTQQTLI